MMRILIKKDYKKDEEIKEIKIWKEQKRTNKVGVAFQVSLLRFKK